MCMFFLFKYIIVNKWTPVRAHFLFLLYQTIKNKLKQKKTFITFITSSCGPIAPWHRRGVNGLFVESRSRVEDAGLLVARREGSRHREGLCTRRREGLGSRHQEGLGSRHQEGLGVVGEGWKRCWCYRRRRGTDNAPGFELPIYCTPQYPRPSQPLGPRGALNYGHRSSCLTNIEQWIKYNYIIFRSRNIIK